MKPASFNSFSGSLMPLHFLMNFWANDVTLSKHLKVLKFLTSNDLANINSEFFSLCLVSLIRIAALSSLNSALSISNESLQSGVIKSKVSVLPSSHFGPWNHSCFLCSSLSLHPLEGMSAMFLLVFIWYHLLMSVFCLISFYAIFHKLFETSFADITPVEYHLGITQINHSLSWLIG